MPLNGHYYCWDFDTADRQGNILQLVVSTDNLYDLNDDFPTQLNR